MIDVSMHFPTDARYQAHGVGTSLVGHWINLTNERHELGALNRIGVCVHSEEFCLQLEQAARECREALERDRVSSEQESPLDHKLEPGRNFEPGNRP